MSVHRFAFPTASLSLVALFAGCHAQCVVGPNDGYYDDGYYDDGYYDDGYGGAGASGGAGGQSSCDASLTVCACDAETGCTAGQSCVGGKCLTACDFDFECGAGQVCGNGQCVSACDELSPCDAGFACVGGGCLVDPANPACLSDNDCDGLACLAGFCSSNCETHADCDADQLCDAGVCVHDGSPQAQCLAANECPAAGQVCAAGLCRFPCAELIECKLIDAHFAACEDSVCKIEVEVLSECSLSLACPAGQACVSNSCVN